MIVGLKKKILNSSIDLILSLAGAEKKLGPKSLSLRQGAACPEFGEGADRPDGLPLFLYGNPEENTEE